MSLASRYVSLFLKRLGLLVESLGLPRRRKPSRGFLAGRGVLFGHVQNEGLSERLVVDRVCAAREVRRSLTVGHGDGVVFGDKILAAGPIGGLWRGLTSGQQNERDGKDESHALQHFSKPGVSQEH